MQMSDFDETIHMLAMANSVYWCGHVLRRENNRVMRALEFEVKGLRKIGKQKIYEKSMLRKKL